MAKVLVLGGSGSVGATLIPLLVSVGHNVTVLNRGTRLMSGAGQIVADRNDAASLAPHAAAFDVVVDTSGYTGDQVEMAFAVFGGLTSKWIHLSSAAVYRETPDILPTEDTPTGGAQIWGDYGAAKSAADDVLLAQNKCPVVILRPPYLYGPKNDNDRETFVWSRVLSDRPVIIPGDGSAQMQFLHVQDLAQIIAHFVVAEVDRTVVYNVAEPETMNAYAWVQRVAMVCGKDVPVISGQTVAADVPARSYFPFRDCSCALNVDRFLHDLKWKFQFQFDAGLQATFARYDADVLKRQSPSFEIELQILGKCCFLS